MRYQFPIIRHIDEVFEAIEGREEFAIKRDEENGYGVVMYLVNFEETFPDPEKAPDEKTARHWAIRRECRGLRFDLETGRITARPFHKFFNLNEKAETQVSQVGWDQGYYRMEKLDGSMITPMLVNGEIRWCTKMGLTDVAKPVDAWTASRSNYHEMARYWIQSNHTPIFEWCSREQRIVIDYPISRLVLTAIRHNETGEYLGHDQLKEEGETYGIPVVNCQRLTRGFSDEVLDELRHLEGEEGEVWYFENGHRLKIKGEWYCQIHKTLEHLHFEKDVIRLILDEKLDDAKPFLPEDLMRAADAFAQDIFGNLRKLAGEIYWEVLADFDNLNGSKKNFAQKVLAGERALAQFKFSTWDNIAEGEEGEDLTYQMLVGYVRERLGSQTKVNETRFLWGGSSWKDFFHPKHSASKSVTHITTAGFL